MIEVTPSSGPQFPPVAFCKHVSILPVGTKGDRCREWHGTCKMPWKRLCLLTLSSPASSFGSLSLSVNLSVSLSVSLSLYLSVSLSLSVSPFPSLLPHPSLYLLFSLSLTRAHAGIYTHACTLSALDTFSSAVSEHALLSLASRKHVLISSFKSPQEHRNTPFLCPSNKHLKWILFVVPLIGRKNIALCLNCPGFQISPHSLWDP